MVNPLFHCYKSNLTRSRIRPFIQNGFFTINDYVLLPRDHGHGHDHDPPHLVLQFQYF